VTTVKQHPTLLRAGSDGQQRPRSYGLPLVATLLASGVAVSAFAVWRQSQPVTFTAPPEPKPILVGQEAFRDPEQAQLYRDAITQGQTRSIALLEKALEAAEKQPEAEPSHLERLRTDLLRRKTLLTSLSKAPDPMLRK
jgi:hypothetical protein